MNTNRLQGLDALRGVAALVVLLFHAPHALRVYVPIERGYLSVDFFFMLSGFVMARTYTMRFDAGFGPAGMLRARFLRFAPTMAVGTVVGMLLLAKHDLLGGAFLAFGLLLIPIAGPKPYPLNEPAWSIFAELVANITHATLWRALTPRVLIAFSVMTVMVLISREGALNGKFLLGIPRGLASYALGVAIWQVDTERRRPPWWLGLAILPGWMLLASGLALPGWSDAVFVLLVCPLALFSGLAQPSIGTRFWNALGLLSFPLYAVHWPIILWASDFYSPVTTTGLALLGGICLAAVSNTNLGWGLRSLWRGWRQVKASTTASEP